MNAPYAIHANGMRYRAASSMDGIETDGFACHFFNLRADNGPQGVMFDCHGESSLENIEWSQDDYTMKFTQRRSDGGLVSYDLRYPRKSGRDYWYEGGFKGGGEEGIARCKLVQVNVDEFRFYEEPDFGSLVGQEPITV